MIFKIYKINALQKKYRESHQMKMNRKPPGPILGHDKQRHAEYKNSEQHKKIFFFSMENIFFLIDANLKKTNNGKKP